VIVTILTFLIILRGFYKRAISFLFGKIISSMKFNQKQIEKAMKKMGIQSQEVEAEEVIIKTMEKDIVISNPQVSRVNMMGQDTFQVSGDVTERPKEKFSEEDIRMVMEQAGVKEEEARKALEETGDIAETILKLKEDK